MNDNNYNEINDRIEQLYGNSQYTSRKQELSKDEKQNIRRIMWLLLVITFVTMSCAILIIFNPFNKNNNNDNSSLPNNNNNAELTIGEIDINHKIVQQLRQRIELSVLDLYYVDTFQYFDKEVIVPNEMPEELKIHLIEKNDLFIDFIVDIGLLDYIETCDDNGLDIPKDSFDKIVQQTLGIDTKIVNDFSKTLHYNELGTTLNLLFSKEGDKYFINCKGELSNTDITKYPHQLLTKAIVIDSGIELYYKVVFVDGNKVYKDYNYQELITESKDDNYEYYIEKGSNYRYTFMIGEENNYYLSKIEKIM